MPCALDHKSAIFADEAAHRDVLDPLFASGRFNHSEEYSDGRNKHTNSGKATSPASTAWSRGRAISWRRRT